VLLALYVWGTSYEGEDGIFTSGRTMEPGQGKIIRIIVNEGEIVVGRSWCGSGSAREKGTDLGLRRILRVIWGWYQTISSSLGGGTVQAKGMCGDKPTPQDPRKRNNHVEPIHQAVMQPEDQKSRI